MLGADIPMTLPAFTAQFGTEDQCREYLMRQRWPDGFRCPRCGCRRRWCLARRPILVCASCQYHCSLTAGTVMQGTRKPLRHWFLAMYLLIASKRSISATELARHLGCSYQTAWAWLHKLRGTMADPDAALLTGLVEVDEGYAGGEGEGRMGRGCKNKMLVVCAAERRGKRATGRIRLDTPANAGSAQLGQFIHRSVRAGSRVHTDGWRGYVGMDWAQYDHRVTVSKYADEDAHTVFPCVHRVFSLVKRMLLGTFHGSVRVQHLKAYLDEFAFRFNRRRGPRPMRMFEHLAACAVSQRCRTYRQIVAHSTA